MSRTMVEKIQDLQKENDKLRAQVSALSDALVEAVRIMAKHDPHGYDVLRNWQQVIVT